MTKKEAAQVLAVKYVYDYNTFQKSERLRRDLITIRSEYVLSDDSEFLGMFEKYSQQLKDCHYDTPLWAKRIMAERYKLNV